MSTKPIRNRANGILSLIILVSLLLAGCEPQATPAPTTNTPEAIMITRGNIIAGSTSSSGSGTDETPPTGLQLRLSEGVEGAPEYTPVTLADAKPLDETATERLLARLPDLPVEPADYQDFAMRPSSLPAPRTGATVQEPFPPAATPAPPESVAGRLEVLRYAPEGAVPLAPNLSVTFNQPMVALTGLSDLATMDVPVKLSPLPAGDWRWVGTRTLVFEPETRFPMATTYSVEIPAGTLSTSGAKLDQATRWTFTTPPPQMQTSYPTSGPQPLEPLMFVAFDQHVDPEAVLATVTVKAGQKDVSIRLASADEIEADRTVRRLTDNANEGYWLAFRAQKPLPADTQIVVSIGPRTPSAEGPLQTEAAQTFSFSTYGPLKIEEHYCQWGDECPPFAPWIIRFSNPLDEMALEESHIRIEPELPGAKVNVYGSTLEIQGRSSGRTKYRVTLSRNIRDQFGQSLGKDETVTFDVGSAEPTLWRPGGYLAVLDPAGRPAYSVFTINYERLNVVAYSVTPEDWPAFKSYLQEYARDERVAPPGQQAFSKTVNTGAKPDEMTEVAIDLSEALQDGLGHVLLIVEPQSSLASRLTSRGGRLPKIVTWVQSTRIGLDACADGSQIIAWANSLVDGASLKGVELSLLPGETTAATDSTGLATFLLESLQISDDSSPSLLVGREGSDFAILPASEYLWSDEGWQPRQTGGGFRWYVFDDRQMYRPGEEVHLKGWIRRAGAGPLGDIEALDEAGRSVSYALRDSRGNELLDGSATVGGLGGFDLVVTLPDTMNLGHACIEFTLEGTGGRHTHRVQVQEFRRPEFEVQTAASQGPHFVGDFATVDVTASYYAGGALPGADVTWRVTTTSGHYSPPGWDDFTFGKWTPWWIFWSYERGYGSEQDSAAETFDAQTDASGKHTLRLDFDRVSPPEPTSVTAEATVMDVNRQAWTSSSLLLVHPSELYVGLRSERMFVQRGDPLRVDAIVTDLDGAPIAGRAIELSAARLEWKYQSGAWQEVEAVVQPCTVKSGTEPARCTFETPEGGTYRIAATVLDDRGRPNRTEMTRWVSGGSRPPSRDVEQEEVTLIPDRKEYQPGDVAEILVQAPFYPAEGLLTLRRSGLVRSERFSMDSSTYTLRVPIEETHIPNLYVQVDLVGAAPRLDDRGDPNSDLPSRPAYATGQLNLLVPPLSRTLALDVTPQLDKLEPGGTTAVDVQVLDATGEPVAGAELAIAVVDEAILALTSYDLSDPLAVFYAQRSADVQDRHLRANLLLASPDELLAGTQQVVEQAVMEKGVEREMAPMAAMPMPTMTAEAAFGASTGTAEAPIAVRTDFNPLAAFVPAVSTDGTGRASIDVKLPDNLTRYRVMVVAVAGGKQFGKGESAITARLPLMVRPSAPRFLNFGDHFELPVVLQNQTDEPMQVDVAVRATNAMIEEPAGQRVIVPANDRIEVRFPTGTISAGTAHFQIAATSGAWADAARFSLPIWTPATTEAFAVYGEVDQGAIAQPVSAPSNAFTQFGGLEITTSSTALQALTDAVLYLVAYRFECSEQLASRILAVAALRDVLTAFQAEGLPSADDIEAAVRRDIEQLRGMQNGDGGFPTWRRGMESWPYHSIHVTNALQRARVKGYIVPQDMLDRSLDYLRNIERHIPSTYGQRTRDTLIAYALNVRQQMGDGDPARARRLIAESGLEKLSPEAIGWLLSVLSDDPNSTGERDAIRRHLLNRVTETAGAAHFVSDYGDQGYVLLHSDRRADGVLLDALIGDQPDSDLIPKIVRGLLAHRKAGRWSNTQENAFILLALDRYFNAYEAQTPDFVARVWLGEQYAGDVEFHGRSTDYHQIDIPMAYLAEADGPQDLILTKEGPGRLYYRLGLRYAPTDLNLEAADYGFTVERVYEAVDDPQDVRKDSDGVWHIKAGARVRVRLTMVAVARRYHVALVDPLPAGFEALNPALAVTGSVPADPGATSIPYYWWRRTWYEHQNMRDEQVEAFTSLLWDGVYTYTYVARATTPGEFIAPPAKAEEMYAPETFGRGATDRVIVE